MEKKGKKIVGGFYVFFSLIFMYEVIKKNGLIIVIKDKILK
jgi:hypothetical protein